MPSETDMTEQPPIDSGARKRLDRIAWLMDNSIRLPGGYRIGLDGIIGLIPGIGDATGAVVSTYILAQAVKAGAPKRVLVQMLLNIGVELGVGAIPIVGDVFDFVFKANQRNVDLIEKHLTKPVETRRRSGLVIAAILALVIGAIIAVSWVAIKIVMALWNLIT